MKLPLQYQVSEYDCGPSSLRNAMSYLFDRDKVPQELLVAIHEISLDGYHAHGSKGTTSVFGTSDEAMIHFAERFNKVSAQYKLGVKANILLDEDVDTHNKVLQETLKTGGVAVAKVMIEAPHYILITGYMNGTVRLFDPYMPEKPYEKEGVVWTTEHPYCFNALVDEKYLNRVDDLWWSFGPENERIVVAFERKASA